MRLTSFLLDMFYSSLAIISLHSDGDLYLPGISSGMLLRPVKTASELGKLSPHIPPLKTVKTSGLLDGTICEG